MVILDVFFSPPVSGRSGTIIYLRTFIRVMVSCSVDYCSFVMKSMMDFAIFMKEIVLTPSKTISD